jgi:hypothetical protein
LNNLLKVVCLLNEKQGIIEDLAGQESATGGGRVWNIFFNDGTELLSYRDEFFVEGDVLQLSSPSYSPKILVNKISIPNNSVYYYLIEKSSGNVGANLEENTIPDLFTFSIKLVDKVNISDISTNQTQAKPKIYAVGLEYKKEIVEVVKLQVKDDLDPTHSLWELATIGATKELFDQQRYLFFTPGDVLQVINKKDKTQVNDIKIINIILYNKTIEYELNGKFQEIKLDILFSVYYVSLKEAYNLEEETQPQEKPIVYAVDKVTNSIVKVNKYKNDDLWELEELNSSIKKTRTRSDFFVSGDVIKVEIWNGSSITYYIEDITEDKIFFKKFTSADYTDWVLDSTIETVTVDYFKDDKIIILEFYNLRELFDQPILVPKDDSGATPLTPTSTILSEIEQAKKDLGQLLFMRNLLSPIDFEQKIEVTQLIAEKQKLINDLNFRGIEEKMATDKFFDDLFEQSFTDIQHEYQDIYNNGEEIDFFTPNGKRSELSFELNEIIRTPQFKEWFGDWELSYLYKDADALELDCSKVLTLNFEPRVVWHGTGQQFSYFILFQNIPILTLL